MSSLQVLFVLFYIFLVIYNYRGYVSNNTFSILTVLTAALSCVLLFASNTANIDWSVVELDMSGYRTLYEQYDVLEHDDFRMYYLFYTCMHLGQSFGLSFRLWWAIMSVLAMSVIFISCKIHNYNYNLFLATFMAYYEIVFFSGFKFFYGFCFLLLAYGYLLKNTHNGRILFILFTCLAGGFHVMYYFYLILLLKPIKKPKYFVAIIVFFTIVFTILMRVSGSAMSFLSPFFNAIDNEHIDRYTTLTVRTGFYIPLFVHAIVVLIAYCIRQFSMKEETSSDSANTLYYTVLVSLLFCPFYGVALTFMRLITAFSLVIVVASSSILSESHKSRLLCARLSILMVCSFIFVRVISSIGGAGRSFFETAVLPYFDIF